MFDISKHQHRGDLGMATTNTSRAERRHREAEPLTFPMAVIASKLSMSGKGLKQAIAADADFPARFMIGKREHVLANEFNAWLAERVMKAKADRRAA